MDDKARDAALKRLGDAMSDISEQCHCAGWLIGTQYLVPELRRRAVTTSRPQTWGHGEVTPQEAAPLIELAKQAGSWADLDERGVGYVPFQPFPVPPEYLASLDREP